MKRPVISVNTQRNPYIPFGRKPCNYAIKSRFYPSFNLNYESVSLPETTNSIIHVYR